LKCANGEASIWDSNIVKAIAALAALVTIVGFFLQYFGKVDFWKFMVLPIANFFNSPVPVYSIPLAFLVVIGGFLLILFISSKLRPSPQSISPSNPFARADMLDTECYRYVAQLAKAHQTANFLKEKYQQFRDYHMIMGGYSSEELMKEMEDRNLLVFKDGKWEVTQKALDYIAKYHSGK
jgi:hypothetical protein